MKYKIKKLDTTERDSKIKDLVENPKDETI